MPASLKDQTEFTLDADDYAEFEAQLEATIEGNTQIQALLDQPSPWDK